MFNTNKVYGNNKTNNRGSSRSFKTHGVVSFIFTVEAKMIKTLVFSAAKSGFKSVISIFCCIVSVGNTCLQFQTLIYPLTVIIQLYVCLITASAPHRDVIWSSSVCHKDMKKQNKLRQTRSRRTVSPRCFRKATLFLAAENTSVLIILATIVIKTIVIELQYFRLYLGYMLPLLDVILLIFKPVFHVSGEGEQLPRAWRQCGSAVLASHQPWSVRHRIRRQDHPHLGRTDHQMHGHGQHQRWSTEPVCHICWSYEVYSCVGL